MRKFVKSKFSNNYDLIQNIKHYIKSHFVEYERMMKKIQSLIDQAIKNNDLSITISQNQLTADEKLFNCAVYILANKLKYRVDYTYKKGEILIDLLADQYSTNTYSSFHMPPQQ